MAAQRIARPYWFRAAGTLVGWEAIERAQIALAGDAIGQ